MVADDKTLLRRMREGRGITDQGWIDSSVDFNRWLRENADKTAPKITLLDETERTMEESVEFAQQWIMDRIK